MLLALLAVNLLVSADWARDRVANRIKEQTGRELTVNGTTALLFAPGPRIVITDAAFVESLPIIVGSMITNITSTPRLNHLYRNPMCYCFPVDFRTGLGVLT